MSGSVYVDFDGTIAPNDPTDELLGRYADPAWRLLEQQWLDGRLSSRECMRRQVELIRATPAELDDFAANIEIDPKFKGFVSLCRRWGARIIVVSDGLDRIIARALAVAGLELPFAANRLIALGADRWQLEFPHARRECRSQMGNCKCSHGISGGGRLNVMVGDGRSDFCIAERANFVLGKERLAAHCRVRGVPHVEFEDFGDATDAMARWFRHALRTATPQGLGLRNR